MAEKVPDFNKCMNPLIQEAQDTPTKINKRKSIYDFIVKLKTMQVKQKILV